MSRKKMVAAGAGIVLSGLFALGAATDHHTATATSPKPPSLPVPFTPPANVVKHVGHDASHAIKNAGKHVKLTTCGMPGTDKAGFLEAPKWRNCTPPPKPYCGSHKTEAQKNYWYDGNCRKTEAQKRAEKRAAAAEAAAEKKAESAPESCAGKAFDIGVVKAMSGDIGGAAEAGKVALDEAGTGDQC